MKIKKIGFTQNGVSACLTESREQRHERENAIALLKLMTLSENEKREGASVNREQLLDGLGL